MKHQIDRYMKHSDSKLVELAKAGDRTALAEIIKKYENKVYNYALKVMQNREDAEDVLQETFLNVIKSIKTFRGESTLSTWIYKITTNTALMKLRSHKKDFESLDENTIDISKDYKSLNQKLSESPLENLYNKEFINNIMHSLDELPVNYRTVFILRDMEGFSAKEVSNILNMSIPAIKSNLRRARMALRDKLSDYLDYKENK